ncbi:MAG: acyl-[acyl-carrier-protein] thioesterase [Chitinispirillaceae bacterium]
MSGIVSAVDISSIPEGMLQTEFTVRSYDVDIRQRATIETIARYLQETAWMHAEELDLGYEHLGKEGLVWVLSRLSLHVHAFPRWADKVYVRTWPRGSSGLMAMRDFQIFSSKGELLVSAGSAWIILDRKRGRPRRPDNHLSLISVLPQKRALPFDPQKISPIAECPECGNLIVRYSDIDMNSHVNNTRYVGWIMDLFPRQFHEESSVRSLEINYLAECSWEDSVTAYLKRTDRGGAVSLVRHRDKVEVIRAEVGC